MCRKTTQRKTAPCESSNKVTTSPLSSSSSDDVSPHTNRTNNIDKNCAASNNDWIGQLDIVAFAEDIRSLGKRLEQEQGDDDVRHLNQLLMWINAIGMVGFLTMGFSVNIITIACISTFVFCRWTMVAHHTCHGGYDKCHPNHKRWHRFRFALGSLWRRWNDWFDWMMPEAWNIEHNNRHHYHLSEIADPDLLEHTATDIRQAQYVPTAVKYIAVLVLALTWKWFYYAPNTYKELKLAQWRKEGRPVPPGVDADGSLSFVTILRGKNAFFNIWELFYVVMGPYLIIHFFLTPLPFLLLEYYYLGSAAATALTGVYYWTAVQNLFYAELLTNVHAFVAVAPNHAGDDMYRFQKPCRPFSGSFYLRQVIASVDFHYGNDVVDTLHGFLNYQIEHHLWPNLSMLSYQKAAPLVKDICAKHGVPYIQQPVWTRVLQTANIMVGRISMRHFPQDYETKFLQLDAQTEKERLSAFHQKRNNNNNNNKEKEAEEEKKEGEHVQSS